MAKKYPVKLSKLGKAVWDLYRDLYRHARPSVDFDELYMESKSKGNPNEPVDIPYDDYYLPHGQLPATKVAGLHGEATSQCKGLS